MATKTKTIKAKPIGKKVSAKLKKAVKKIMSQPVAAGDVEIVAMDPTLFAHNKGGITSVYEKHLQTIKTLEAPKDGELGAAVKVPALLTEINGQRLQNRLHQLLRRRSKSDLPPPKGFRYTVRITSEDPVTVVVGLVSAK